MNKIAWFLLIAIAANIRAADITATNSPATNAPGIAKIEPAIPDASQKPVCTTNTVTIAGQRVKYVAETGMLPILKADGTTSASVFYVAYTRVDEPGSTESRPTKAGGKNSAARPVTFCFNGGPGSASVWLHLGGLGPRRVNMNADGTLPPPPFALVDNEYSILDTTDLVFIDPVATGFSRPAKDAKREDFFGDANDLNSVGEFIRLWTTRNERWLSPKYLCGESYGVFRAAGLAEHLRGGCGMYLNGIMFVSGVLDFGTIWGQTGNDLPYALILPAYTAAAQFHKKLPPELQNDLPKALAESRAFAGGEYTAALLQGAALSATETKKIAAQLARLTGLKQSVVEDNKLRIDEGVFRKQLLRDEGLILGVYDTRITGHDNNPAASYPDFDPSSAAIRGPFAAAINSYLRSELKFVADLPYELIAGVQPWNYGIRNNYANASDKLAAAMSQNAYLRVLVLGGRSDLVCPVDSMRHALDHMTLAPAYRTNISYAEYAAGHMMYVNLPDLVKMQQDLKKFLKP